MGRSNLPIQPSLPLPPPKASWGGSRKGAGRPPIKDRRASEHHKTRPVIKASEPAHVICRIAKGIGSMRRRHMYAALREATIVATHYADTFRIIHLSIQGTHLHLIIEAQSRRALSRGMQAFLISAAKQIKRAYRERTGNEHDGVVFTDRYHLKILKAPRQVRHTLAYVLKNASHCTISGRRVEFPTNCARTTLLRTAERSAGYRRPGFEDFVWDWSSMTLAGQIDLQIRYGPGVPEQLHS